MSSDSSSENLQACRLCHSIVYQFLNSSFDETLSQMDVDKNDTIPSYYTPELHKETQTMVRNTLKIYEDVLNDYSMEELSISYNGGKDCLVMLVIYLAAIYEKTREGSLINSVYINNEEAFEEQDKFLDNTVKYYGLDFIPIRSEMKEGFERYLEMKSQIKAIIVGIRRIDPYGEKLNISQRTDNGWPDFVRIHPVLEWKTSEVWYFLKATRTEYCELYDKGYTSLGGRNSTIQNPLLKQKDGKYLAAYMLDDDRNERLSRVKRREEKL
ncbi:hypothetical protein FOA43_002020 [Brettanomyces nanus]|uniref:FAD synthase n=1 Tax=Eeniella nana TaxID=13502 RepID=A0A875RUL0_EENNA|nr:uncharacterized protein FOA43_002020 [Brettanomyces nanus]QPG74687.1 hypothetical protein FOA43_002020 [Brettanomyces nanus]